MYPVREEKDYSHVFDLLNDIVLMRIEDKVGMKGKAQLEEHDPRRLSRTLALEPPPPTAELVSAQRSRFLVPEAVYISPT